MYNSKSFSGSTLKIIACITMFIDHLAATVLHYYINTLDSHSALFEHMSSIESLMRYIGRLAFPLFAYLLVEGFVHTKHLTKYALNLFVFAIVSEIPFDLAIWDGQLFYFSYQNVIFTMLIGLLTLTLIKNAHEINTDRLWLHILSYFGSVFFALIIGFLFNSCFIGVLIGGVEAAYKPLYPTSYPSLICFSFAACVGAIIYIFRQFRWDMDTKVKNTLSCMAVLAGLIIANTLSTDYSAFGVLTIVIMYLFRNNPKKAMTLGCVALVIFNPTEIFAFFDIPIIKRYNGSRGINAKYFFYIFYPAHLFLFYLICKLMGTL